MGAVSSRLCIATRPRHGVTERRPCRESPTPQFQYDPTFPQPLPENWAIGAIGGWRSTAGITCGSFIGPARCKATSASRARAQRHQRPSAAFRRRPCSNSTQRPADLPRGRSGRRVQNGRRSSTGSSSITKTTSGCGQRGEGRARFSSSRGRQVHRAVRASGPESRQCRHGKSGRTCQPDGGSGSQRTECRRRSIGIRA